MARKRRWSMPGSATIGNSWKITLKNFITATLMVALLFVTYGSVDWTAAWIFIGLSTVAKAVFSRYLKKRDPELVRRRREVQAGTKGWDKVWLGLFALMFLAILAVSGLDAGRYHWSEMPWWVMALGGAGYVVSMIFTFFAMAANTHFEGTVRIQTDRNHKVVDQGPYRYIRHPGYAALIVTMLSIPAALGSVAGLVPAGLVVVMFVVRTALEDATLQRELAGYRQYADTVRYRLVPGVW
jgi:protein-S-isoprenylcysteine O-methyltransferase Ste14